MRAVNKSGELPRTIQPPPDPETTEDELVAAGATLAIHEFVNRQVREQLEEQAA